MQKVAGKFPYRRRAARPGFRNVSTTYDRAQDAGEPREASALGRRTVERGWRGARLQGQRRPGAPAAARRADVVKLRAQLHQPGFLRLPPGGAPPRSPGELRCVASCGPATQARELGACSPAIPAKPPLQGPSRREGALKPHIQRGCGTETTSPARGGPTGRFSPGDGRLTPVSQRLAVTPTLRSEIAAPPSPRRCRRRAPPHPAPLPAASALTCAPCRRGRHRAPSRRPRRRRTDFSVPPAMRSGRFPQRRREPGAGTAPRRRTRSPEPAPRTNRLALAPLGRVLLADAALAPPVPRTLPRTSPRSSPADQQEGLSEGAGSRVEGGEDGGSGRVTHSPTNQESAPGKEAGRHARKKRVDSMTQSRELGPRVPDRCEGRREVSAAWGLGGGFRRPSSLPGAGGGSIHVCAAASPAWERGRRNGGEGGAGSRRSAPRTLVVHQAKRTRPLEEVKSRQRDGEGRRRDGGGRMAGTGWWTDAAWDPALDSDLTPRGSDADSCPVPGGKPRRAVLLFFADPVQGVGGQRESVVVKINMQERLEKQ